MCEGDCYEVVLVQVIVWDVEFVVQCICVDVFGVYCQLIECEGDCCGDCFV